jgi:transcriptional regulator of arginine metabolism
MTTKKERLTTIFDLVNNHSLGNQEELLILLRERGFDVTQATLSRDIKQLKIIKSPDAAGNYIYTVPRENYYRGKTVITKEPGKGLNDGFLSLDFSDRLGLIKTRPGYAMGIASDIDNRISHVILGTIAGDDTILLIPRDGFDREQIREALKGSIIEEK